MEHKKLSKEFQEYLDSLNTGYKNNNWVFIGKTNDAFGSPGGSWQGKEGYKFKEEKSNQEYLLRSIPENGYIVLESYSTRRQVYNMDLSKTTIHQSKNNKSILLESYTMTAGKGRVKKQDVKDAFKNLGVNSNQIAEISDSNPNWADLVESLLTWANHRERVKKLLKTTSKVMKEESKEEEKQTREEELNSLPLNQIFFGPPGTGKTYHTVNEALKVVGIDTSELTRTQIKQEFDKKLKEGQIVFTTFHQSMSYEEFIEGIKPVDPKDDEEILTYKVEPGVFKRLSIEASFNIARLGMSKEVSETLDFSNLYDMFIEEIQEKLINNEEVKIKTKSGGTVLIDSISQQGNIIIKHHNGTRTYTVSKPRLTKLQSSITSLDNVSNINDEFREVIGGSNSSAYWSVLNAIKQITKRVKVKTEEKTYAFEDKVEVVKKMNKVDFTNVKGKNYVLIVDEINRGNVSQIFGELITLIEADKRLGKDEALEVSLPYSKEKFGVPPNLYIIGTMNTADRSVEALDTALRRRFSFTEMPPRYDLSGLDYEFAGVKGFEILRKINRRIEKLLDRDHLIGHSYFLLNEEEKLNPEPKLLDSFYRNIIPLLQEYFFGDYAKIGAVLGNGFVYTENENDQADFATGYENEDFAEKDIFQIIDYRSEQPGNHYIQPEMSFEKAIRLLMNQTLTD